MRRTPLFAFLIVAISWSATDGLLQQPGPRQARQKGIGGAKEPCGNSSQLAAQVEVCAKPLMDIIEGTMDKWPKNENDVEDLCTEFEVAQKCVRERGRRCGKGLERVIISTVANSVVRTKKRECAKARLNDILKTTKCIEAHKDITWAIISNATNRMSVIEKMQSLDQRTTAVCCTITDIEKELLRLFKQVCPNEAQIMVRMYRSVLQDAMDIICLAPKCQNSFRGYTIPKVPASTTEGIVAFMMRIVFSLGS